jgi:thiol-disulfide isomerase/thioredoxin
MRLIFTTFLFILFSFSGVAAQSGRVGPKQTSPPGAAVSETADLTAEQMYTEASLYARNKYAEYEQKKVPYNKTLHEKTLRDQKQLAAKYALLLADRENLSADDVYYLGMLHLTAGSAELAAETMRKYLASENPNAEKAQTARSVLVVAAAERKNFEEAEKYLAEYLKNSPVKLRERAKMETDLAKNYKSAGNGEAAAKHAEEAYRAAKALFQDATSRARGLNELLETGMTVFEIYKQNGKIEQADKTLDDLRKTAVFVEASGIFYASVDARIKFMIETGRKPAAMEFFQAAYKQAETEFKNAALKNDVLRNLRKREKHYKLLGDTAPELVDVDQWFPGQMNTLANMRGKVVLLDFWATWCIPCLEVFPHLIGWQQQFQKDGLEILGLTRYYGEVRGATADKSSEIEFLKNFRRSQNLSYDFVVSKNTTNQINYGATSIPTTVLIDRKGVVRYIEAGANREEEIGALIEKLLQEK